MTPNARIRVAPGLTRRHCLALAGGVVVTPLASATPWQAQRRPLFGSAAELLLPHAVPADAAATVWQQLSRVHHAWNAWKPGELQRLNQAFREGRSARVGTALHWMIRQAAVLEQMSMGLFNPAIGGLVGAWGFHADVLRPGHRPSAASLSRWQRAAPSLAQIEVQGERLHCRNPALQLDFGGYAKGLAIDWALDHLQRQGVADALLNLGGNLAAMGRQGGRPWQVGVRDPHGEGLLARLETRGREAVVTSGDYERYRWLDGERFGHVIDPTTGAPAAGFSSVTVVHPSAALADAGATALLVAGPERWRRVAERLRLDSVLAVDRDGRVLVTPRLASRLQRVAD